MTCATVILVEHPQRYRQYLLHKKNGCGFLEQGFEVPDELYFAGMVINGSPGVKVLFREIRPVG